MYMVALYFISVNNQCINRCNKRNNGAGTLPADTFCLTMLPRRHYADDIPSRRITRHRAYASYFPPLTQKRPRLHQSGPLWLHAFTF
jgi:hypothetical protein